MKPEYERLAAPYFAQAELPKIEGDQPLVSINCSYYANAEYLDDFLDSLIGQVYQNWELLFVNDASPDTPKALEILARYPDPRIKYSSLQKNSGAHVARTHGFHLSTGDYIMNFDPDDIMHPWYLQALMAKALSPAAPDIVMMDYLLIGSINKHCTTVIRTEKELTLTNWIPGTSLTTRRLWQATGGQSSAAELRFGSQDWEFWLHCAEKCGPLSVAHVPLPLLLYRRHTASICAKSDLYEHILRNRILEDHPAIFQKYGTGQEFLMQGYRNSVTAHLAAHRWREALSILGEARRKLPLRLLAPSIGGALWTRASATPRRLWHKCRHLGRKYVLDPLGLLPKRKD